jgi:hypothetical protein
MVASNNTIDAVAQVIRKHVDRDTITKLCRDLIEIPGNKSFRDTIEILVKKLKERQKL